MRLDEGRLVFVGKHPDHPGVNYIGFRNSEGRYTRFTLSDDALAAFRVCSDPNSVAEIGEFPIEQKPVWRIISETEMNEMEGN